MFTKKQNIFQKLQVHNQVAALTITPTLSAAEQTRLTWARPIKAYDAVPEVFRPFFAPLVASGQAFPYCVLTPSYAGFFYKETEKLVCDLGDAIQVLEKSGATFTAQCFPLGGISYVEVQTMLLDSRINISGVTSQSLPAACTLRFNTVTDYLFTPILEKIRFVAVGSRETAERSEMEKFNRWSETSFKFMNFARRSLLGREKVLQSILQPEIRAPRLTILGKTFYKTLALSHASILTDRELIMIREEQMPSGNGKYGGSWIYLPLQKIVKLTVNAREDGLLVFFVQLPENERLEFLFQAAARPEIDQLLAQFRELAG